MAQLRSLASCSTLARAGVLALALVAFGTSAGCRTWGYSPNGVQASIDQYTYESTGNLPLTVTVRDWTTNEVIWSMEVPVGKQVTIRFLENQKSQEPSRPDTMFWEVQDRGVQYGNLDNSLPVPPAINRRIDVVVRKTTDAVAKPASLPAAEPTGTR